VWFDDDIGVGRFSIYVAIWKACQMNIQNCYGFVNLLLPCELDTWVDCIKAIVESRSRVRSLSAAAEP
jgi:hypothetical protein